MIRPLAIGLCLVPLGAAPADPLLARLLAGAAAVPPASLAFERSTQAVQVTGDTTERRQVVDRWDGHAWSVVSVNGQPPTPRDAAAILKADNDTTVPGYHGVGIYLGAGAVRGTGPHGEIVYRLAHLPKAGIGFRGAPADRFAAELTVDDSGPVPIVRHARFYATAPMRVLVVARLDRFEATADYRFGVGGKPELVRQTIDLAGALFGRDGTQHSDVTYVHR